MSVLVDMPQVVPIVAVPEVEFVSPQEVRRSLVGRGDIREEIAFQNDINALIAAVDEVKAPWRALAPPVTEPEPRFPFNLLRRRAA